MKLNKSLLISIGLVFGATFVVFSLVKKQAQQQEARKSFAQIPDDDFGEEDPVIDPNQKYTSTETSQEIVVSGEAELPSNWPTDIPVFPQATLSPSLVSSQSETNWISDQSVQLVTAWYLNNLSEYGWLIILPPSDPSSTFQQTTQATKGDSLLEITVRRESNSDLTQITVLRK